MRIRVPWLLAGALGALYVGIASAAAVGGALHVAGYSIVAIALAGLFVARAIVEPVRAHLAMSEALGAFVGASAICVSTFAGGIVAPTRALAIVRAGAVGTALALAWWILWRMPGRGRVRAWVAPLGVPAAAFATIAIGWPHRFQRAPLEWLQAAFAVFAAVPVIRGLRTPDPLQRANWWYPSLGAASFVLFALVALRPLGATAVAPGVATAFGISLAALGLVVGASGRWPESSHRVARASAALVVAAAVGLGVLLGGLHAPIAVAAAATAAMVSSATFARVFRSDGGRLLDSVASAIVRLRTVERYDDFSAAVLEPLRDAAGDLRSTPQLWVLPAATKVTIDVAGNAHVSPFVAAKERDLLTWLRARATDIVFADALRPVQVRRSETRPVLAALDEHGAFAAIPLRDGDELAGVLLLPRGNREAWPSAEELVALRDLSEAAGGALARIHAVERAARRATEAVREAQASALRESTLAAERDAAREHVRAMRDGRALGSLEDTWVGYSEAMRTVDARLGALASADAPVLILCEAGSDAIAVARRIHRASRRARGAFVVADAAEMHPSDVVAALAGDARTNREPVRATDRDVDAGAEGSAEGHAPGESTPPRAGWLELAHGGSLVLENLPALGHEAHVVLARAMRERAVRRVGAEADTSVDVRVLATSRVPLIDLPLPDAIVRAFDTTTLTLPPLRSRTEDIENLVLLGLDRACRMVGRATLGISRDALTALRAYLWPGNVRELFEALEYAVRRARGALVRLEDLPVQTRSAMRAPVVEGEAASEAPPDAAFADESFDGLERRILETAMSRASGNKSEAARMLGLARTTFLDKLRKHGLRP